MTIIDCENSGRGFHFCRGEDSLSILMGFTVKNGFSTDDGGGISCEESSPTIASCTILRSWAYYDGGGIYCKRSEPTITNCTIKENAAYIFGGGICCYKSDPTITNCIILGNRSDWSGGGIYSLESDPIVSNCIVSKNAAFWGGGIYCYESFDPVVINCTISENTSCWGGGIFCEDSSPTITNCILWEDSPNEIYIESGTAAITFSDIQGGVEGEGNIDEDPCCVMYHGFQYLLRPKSPCIDTGDPDISDTLYDWHPLIPSWYKDGKRSDMGAYGGPKNHKWFTR
jgi:hypothetical protein